jgi:hypothetical protein
VATDLRALRAKADALNPGDPKAAKAEFDAEVKYRASIGDLLCYGLYVHGSQAPVLRNLAYAKHAFLIASTMEASGQTLVVCPPEHGKSALMRWEMEMWIGIETERCYADPNHTVPSAALVMNTASQSEKQIMEIERTIERNPHYKELFPHVRPDKGSGWTKDHFFLQRPGLRSEPIRPSREPGFSGHFKVGASARPR